METIKLYKANEVWVGRFSDPEVIRVMGTDLIPTAFFVAMPAKEVLERIKRLNPGTVVTTDV